MKKNSRKGYKYTPEELDYIAEKFGMVKTAYLAKQLGRSKQAIEKKALEIFGTANGNSVQGLYNSEEVASMLGVWKGAVADWINKRGLPATKKYKTLKGENKGSVHRTDKYSIDLEVFFEWLKENKNNVKIDFDKVDIAVLPFSPDWFKEDYKNKNHYHVGNRKEWSQKEIHTLLLLYHSEGRTMKEIAEILGRSYKSVRKKKQYLDDKGIPKSLTKVA